MPTTTKYKPRYDGLKVTREEYLDLEDDGFQYDMIDGVLYMSPSAFYKHGRSQILIASVFVQFLQKTKMGEAVSEIDVYLPDNDDVLRPDISVVLKENYGIIKGHIHGVPDLVVEVLSASTMERDLGIKAERYLANGVKEYWIADPDKKSISLWINESKTRWRKIEGDQIESYVLPGLILGQKDIFPPC